MCQSVIIQVTATSSILVFICGEPLIRNTNNKNHKNVHVLINARIVNSYTHGQDSVGGHFLHARFFVFRFTKQVKSNHQALRKNIDGNCSLRSGTPYV